MSLEKDLPPPYSPVAFHETLPINLDASAVSDYLPWSIVNLFFGWGFFGIIPLVCSIVCRNEKSANNLNGARTMSTMALILNIIITTGGVIGWIAFIVLASGYIVALKVFT
ncbi:unnamed protein product [Rotaria socialis]|uniref:Uncharacterized protein n=1 Tax=Rotaria socialis TaxID=392032 RepID=A0A820PEA1_9BILA|nr:unnamed protein product [Rotaria socialis]CAF3376561.1 unnamed protein product [Rotaria socialis]CAF3467272.1 unnamed protein product [Rotaria socialis]CAF3639821.1 unnamed protein product [Rotaria socialis]CAF3706491.1 unnamed protein product [Rotaria socialis]